MIAPMYDSTSYLEPIQEQDHHVHAASRTAYDSARYLQPCAAGSLQLSAHRQCGQADPAAAGGGSAAAGVQQQQPRRANKKKHGARPPSRRSSTTVVTTDVANFRDTVQELTGFPPAAIFRPLPRRVHAAVSNPFVVAAAAGHQGCGGDGRGQASSETTNTDVQPVMAQPPPGVFDGLPDIGSPVFDSWADLSTE